MHFTDIIQVDNLKLNFEGAFWRGEALQMIKKQNLWKYPISYLAIQYVFKKFQIIPISYTLHLSHFACIVLTYVQLGMYVL